MALHLSISAVSDPVQGRDRNNLPSGELTSLPIDANDYFREDAEVELWVSLWLFAGAAYLFQLLGFAIGVVVGPSEINIRHRNLPRQSVLHNPPLLPTNLRPLRHREVWHSRSCRPQLRGTRPKLHPQIKEAQLISIGTDLRCNSNDFDAPVVASIVEPFPSKVHDIRSPTCEERYSARAIERFCVPLPS